MYQERGFDLAVYEGPALELAQQPERIRPLPTALGSLRKEAYSPELAFHVVGSQNGYWATERGSSPDTLQGGVPDELRDVYERWSAFHERDHVPITAGKHALDYVDRQHALAASNKPKELEAAPSPSSPTFTAEPIEFTAPTWVEDAPSKPRRLRKLAIALGAVAAAITFRKRR